MAVFQGDSVLGAAWQESIKNWGWIPLLGKIKQAPQWHPPEWRTSHEAEGVTRSLETGKNRGRFCSALRDIGLDVLVIYWHELCSKHCEAQSGSLAPPLFSGPHLLPRTGDGQRQRTAASNCPSAWPTTTGLLRLRHLNRLLQPQRTTSIWPLRPFLLANKHGFRS